MGTKETTTATTLEETLDPRDWGPLKDLGRRMVDDMLGYLESVRERPCWQPPSEEALAALRRPLPQEGEGAEAAYRAFQEHVLPYPVGNIHPRFWGWVNGTGSGLDMLSEMLAAGMNPNSAGFHQASTYVELQVIDWLKEMLGYPARGSGVLVSGGSVANLVGLAAARSRNAGFDVRRQGLCGGPRLTVYGSSETHYSVQKAVEMLGLGSESLRATPVHDDLTVDVDALAEAVRRDRRAGMRPIAVVGNAGTINSGAVDDLDALADLCVAEELWLHVDGAFGALAWLVPRTRPLLKGMGRADSLAFDLHKWMYLPYDVGCTLVRTREEHENAFAITPAYLQPAREGVAQVPSFFSHLAPELSRGFRALKVWMALKARGVQQYARLIEQNIDQAAYLARRVEESDDLELMAPAQLNIVCLRAAAPELSGEAQDDLNARLLERIQMEGIAVPSSTVVAGRTTFRVAITNHRTTRADLDFFLEALIRMAREERKRRVRP